MIDFSVTRMEGPNLVLRLIKPKDAAYVHSLRTNSAYNSHLSRVIDGIDDQREWIENYKVREAAGQEVYYVIERKDGVRCGLVRMYDFGSEHFTWGSWILDENKPYKAALESALLSFGVGFRMLGKKRAMVDVRVGNKKAIAFYRRFGMVQTHSDCKNIYFEYPRESFEATYDLHMRILQTEAST